MASYTVELFTKPYQRRGRRIFDAATDAEAITVAEYNLARTGADFATVDRFTGNGARRVTTVKAH